MKIYLLLILYFCSFILAAKERKLRIISINDDNVLLSSGISCIHIESTVTCYGVNLNRSIIYFINKNLNWSSWNMIILEDSIYDIQLDGISCVNRNNIPKCYLRMINIGYENLIEINPLKKTWYQLCDHLAIKPIIIINQQININIFYRTIKNEFYHKYVQNNQWNLNQILPDNNNQSLLIGESNCLTIDHNQNIICFYRTNNPFQLIIWSKKLNSFQWIDNQKENDSIEISSDLSCHLSINDNIICFIVNQYNNIYGILCQFNLICSKWILINSKINYFQKIKPISFIYQNQNIAIYALANNNLSYITTCQQCSHSIQNWNNQWSQWMELTSKPLLAIETTFTDFQENNIYVIALTQQFTFTYSIFDYQNHIPYPFLDIK